MTGDSSPVNMPKTLLLYLAMSKALKASLPKRGSPVALRQNNLKTR